MRQVQRNLAKNAVTVIVPALVVVALDQYTKRIVIQRLALGAHWPAEPVAGLFTFTHVSNTGVAFGLFQGNSPVFVVLAACVVGALILYVSQLPRHAVAVRLAVGMQIGGAVGNVIDRVRLGHVTDFFDFHVFPVFNVADSAIVVGVFILALTLWQEEQARAEDHERAAQSATNAGRIPSSAPDQGNASLVPGWGRTEPLLREDADIPLRAEPEAPTDASMGGGNPARLVPSPGDE
jgi:signal peptidase II